jgi:hypothetical protein
MPRTRGGIKLTGKAHRSYDIEMSDGDDNDDYLLQFEQEEPLS